MNKPFALTLSALALVLCARHADAQSLVPRRVVGFGLSFGLGVDHNNLGETHSWPLLPTLTLNVPISQRVEVEVWAPVSNLILADTTAVKGWAWVDVSARWYALRPSSGLFVQAGLGFMHGHFDNDPSFTVLRVPARVGWEFSRSRVVAFQISVRPWLDVVLPGGDIPAGTRLGGVVELGWNFYVTRSP